jgi:hypothetical protein
MPKIDDRIEALASREIRRGAAIVILLLGAIIGARGKAAAAVLKYAGHSLNREDASKVEAVARAALPRSVRLFISRACWTEKLVCVG